MSSHGDLSICFGGRLGRRLTGGGKLLCDAVHTMNSDGFVEAVVALIGSEVVFRTRREEIVEEQKKMCAHADRASALVVDRNDDLGGNLPRTRHIRQSRIHRQQRKGPVVRPGFLLFVPIFQQNTQAA
jgi:hypothetical protein